MAWSKRTQRRVLLIVAIMIVLAGGVIAARLLLDWRRARAFDQARASGLAAFEQGDHPTCLEVLGPLVGRSPDDLELVRAVAVSRLRIEEPDGGHLPRAAVLFQRVVELDPDDLEARKELLRVYPRLGFLRETLDMADSILESNAEEAEALEARVQILAALGRWTEAADACARLVDRDPGSARWKRLQVSTALASGLEPAEVVELAQAWPKGPIDDGLDDLVLAALFSLAGEPGQASVLVDAAIERGAANGSRLESMLSMLADLGRGAEAERLIRKFASRGDLDDVDFASLAGRWGFATGRGDFLLELVDGLPAGSESRVELVVPLAMLSIDLDSASRDRWLDELERCSPTRTETVRSRDAILAARRILAKRDLDAFKSLRSVALARQSTVIEKLAAARAALAIGDPISANRLSRLAEQQEQTFLGSLMLMESTLRRGELIEAIDVVLEAIVRYPDRLEYAIALVTIWSDARPLPRAVGERILATVGTSSPLDLALRVVDLVGINSATATSLAAAAINQRRPDVLEDVVVALLAIEPPPTEVMLNIRRRISDISPILAERLGSRLLEAAPTNPRVAVISVDSTGSDEERVEALRGALSLESDDAAARIEAWATLVDELGGVSGPAFRQVAAEALVATPRELAMVSRILYDPRTWEDRDLSRQVIDRLGELRGEDSVDLLLAKASWLLRFDRDNKEERLKAISRLNTELLSSPDSYSIGATLLRLMIADSTTDPQSAIRLGRRLLSDRPESAELYPLVIDLMQAQGMLAEADRLLREFEAIDLDGQVSSRQRAASSLRQGNLDDLVRSLTTLADRSGQGRDSLALGRARIAVGDLVGAEQAYRAALADESVRAEALLRLGPVMQRLGRLSEFEAMLADSNSGLSELQRALAIAEVQLAAGDASSAVTGLQERAPMLGDESLFWRGVSVAMLSAGDRGGAAEAAIKGLRLDPQSDDLVSILITGALEEPAIIGRLTDSAAEGSLPAAVTESLRVLRTARDDASRLVPDSDDLRVARELCSRYGDSLGAWRVAVALHQIAGQPSEAMALAVAASRRFPESPDPVQWQVFAASSSGDLEKATALCVDWRRLRFPDVRPVDEAQAALELARDRPEAALVLLNRHRDLIVAEGSTRPGPYRALVASLILSGQVREAARLEQTNLGRSEASATTWAEISAMAPYERGLEAMSILEAASATDAGARARMVGRWVSFHERHPNGRALDRARALLPRGILSPVDYDSRIAVIARSDVERASEDADSAVRSLRSVIDSYPADVQRRAVTIGTLSGQPQLELFREIEPLIYARNNLAMLLVQQDTSLDDALELVEQCLEVLPGNSGLRDTHALVLLAIGRFADAERSAVMAIGADPRNPSVLLTGAEILAATGRSEDSRVLLRRVRDIVAQEPWPSRQVEDRLRRVASAIDSQP